MKSILTLVAFAASFAFVGCQCPASHNHSSSTCPHGKGDQCCATTPAKAPAKKKS